VRLFITSESIPINECFKLRGIPKPGKHRPRRVRGLTVDVKQNIPKYPCILYRYLAFLEGVQLNCLFVEKIYLKFQKYRDWKGVFPLEGAAFVQVSVEVLGSL